LVLITRSHDSQNAPFPRRGNSGVPGFRGSAAERHVDYGGGLAALGNDVVCGPFEACDDGGGGAAAVFEDFDGDEGGVLGDAVGCAADNAGDVTVLRVRFVSQEWRGMEYLRSVTLVVCVEGVVGN